MRGRRFSALKALVEAHYESQIRLRERVERLENDALAARVKVGSAAVMTAI